MESPVPDYRARLAGLDHFDIKFGRWYDIVIKIETASREYSLSVDGLSLATGVPLDETVFIPCLLGY